MSPVISIRFVCLLCTGLLRGTEAFVPFGKYNTKRGGTAFSVVSSTEIEDVLRRVTEEHTAEVKFGTHQFGNSVHTEHGQQPKVWSDTEFISRSVGVGNAGPDEQVLCRGDEVFQTLAPVVATVECEELISEAREIIQSGLLQEETTDGQRAGEVSNSQLGECRVSQMPRGRQWLNRTMSEKLFPLLESRFGGNEDDVIRADELTLHDALIIGYGYFGAPTVSQPIHRDTSILSLNIALSPSSDYVGGGTYFEGLDDGPVQNEQGRVVCHAGGAMHAGTGIESGERWVLVLFVLAKNAPQLARRCHNEGMHKKREGKMDEAANSFMAGLNIAPRDHLLHLGIGSVHMAKGDKAASQVCLKKSSEFYHLSQQPLISLGNMLLEDGLHLEALQSYDLALERMGVRDLLPGALVVLRAEGYHARRNAARCALICADQEAANGEDTTVARTRLPVAIDRVNTCLRAAPGDELLHRMLARAEELLA